MTTSRVLLADDQALLRHGLQMMVDAQPGLEVVGEAADGAEAVELAARLNPDVVLMDIRMPRMDGVEATRRICGAAGPDGGPKVIVLTTFRPGRVRRRRAIGRWPRGPAPRRSPGRHDCRHSPGHPRGSGAGPL